MEIRDYLRSVRAHWVLAVTMLVLAVAASCVTTFLLTPSYSATTRLFVSTSDAGSGSDSTTSQFQDAQFSQQRVLSYAEIIKGTRMARLVIDELNADISPAQLASEISTEVVADTVLLDVTVTDADPVQAQILANTTASEFIGFVDDLELDEGEESSGVIVTIVQAADLPRSPIVPDVPLNLGLGALVGLLLGIGLAILRGVLDNTVKSETHVQDLTGASTIGAVMYESAMGNDPLTTLKFSSAKGAESYRQIRTNLQFVNVDDPPRVLVVTSAVPGEGKTTTAINLALVLAQSGQRVVLMEADLRRPRVTRYMRLIGGSGLTNLLAGRVDLADVIQPFGDGKLSVIASGPNPPNPSELLGSAHMKNLLDELRDTHDYVVIDAPPLLPVTDAAVLAVLADGAVIVTRHGVTRREQLRLAADSLRAIDARLLGIIINMVPQRTRSYGYGYGYGYGYEYSSEMGAEELAAAASSRRSPLSARRERRRNSKKESADR